MKQLIAVFISFLLGCTSLESKSPQIRNTDVNGPYHKVLFPFNDSSWYISVSVFDTVLSGWQVRSNAIISYMHKKAKVADTLFFDSVLVRNSKYYDEPFIIFREDVNLDKQEDILISGGYDGKMNIGYHLYLVDTGAKSVSKVEGFEAIGNPQVDSITGLISSYVMSARLMCNFYTFNKGCVQQISAID